MGGIATMAPLLNDAPRLPPEELIAGGVYWVNANRPRAHDQEVRQRADTELAKLQRSDLMEREEEHYLLLLYGGFLSGKSIDASIDAAARPRNQIAPKDPRDKGPPRRIRGPP